MVLDGPLSGEDTCCTVVTIGTDIYPYFDSTMSKHYRQVTYQTIQRERCKYSMSHESGPTDTMEKFTSTVVYISSD